MKTTRTQEEYNNKMAKQVKDKIKLYEYICPEPDCYKHIASVSKTQFEYNKMQHIDSHKRKLKSQESKKTKGEPK